MYSNLIFLLSTLIVNPELTVNFIECPSWNWELLPETWMSKGRALSSHHLEENMFIIGIIVGDFNQTL